MSKSQFEKLIEYVINDEEAKARELFHNIVVEKSRSIYESIMEEESEEEESIEEAADEEEESVEESMDGSLGGDQSDDLIDDVEAEEQGMQESEDEFAMGDDGMDDDGEGEEGEEGGLEGRVVKLEDELDRLMAEFEDEFGPMGDDEGGIDDMGGMDDTLDMTTSEVDDDELETEGMMEAVTLKAAPKPVTSEPAGTNTRSINDNNSGSKGPIGGAVKPVHMTGTEAQGRPAPGTKELIGKVGNSPAGTTQDPKPATKPHLAQATGVNTKSPNLGRKG